ncbi:MAG: hypothetical protein ABSF89_07610 [Acidimicrobiales bacterium]|jgi:hypothetical protein
MTGPRKATPATCIICRQQVGEVEVPAGNLVDEALVVAFHAPAAPGGTCYLGHLLVSHAGTAQTSRASTDARPKP